jgi:hypothetical protein
MEPGTDYRVRVECGFSYVLVLEWLVGDKRLTGTELHEFLLSKGFRSQLVVCRCPDDVRLALAEATATVKTAGVPLVHLEAHGSDPWKVEAEDLCFGAHEGASVTWSQLGEWLAPLNAASDFRLLCVSAACFGSGVMGGIDGGTHVAPFANAIGFRTSVNAGDLHKCMREVYRRLKAGDALLDCVASAQRELVGDQKINLEVALELARKILRHVYYSPTARDSPLGPLRRRRRARIVWDRWFPAALQARDPAYRFDVVGIDPLRAVQ